MGGSSRLPLRGAAQLREGGGCFCSLIVHSWGCSVEGEKRLGELPLRGAAARLREGGVFIWGSSRCAGLLDKSIEGEKRLLLGELPLRGAAP